jgi:hypothetical protein
MPVTGSITATRLASMKDPPRLPSPEEIGADEEKQR